MPRGVRYVSLGDETGFSFDGNVTGSEELDTLSSCLPSSRAGPSSWPNAVSSDKSLRPDTPQEIV